MYKVDTLLMMRDAVTATVLMSHPSKKLSSPRDQQGVDKERATMARARATNVRAMQT